MIVQPRCCTYYLLVLKLLHEHFLQYFPKYEESSPGICCLCSSCHFELFYFMKRDLIWTWCRFLKFWRNILKPWSHILNHSFLSLNYILFTCLFMQQDKFTHVIPLVIASLPLSPMTEWIDSFNIFIQTIYIYFCGHIIFMKLQWKYFINKVNGKLEFK